MSKPVWNLIDDEMTVMKFTVFFERKFKIGERMCERFTLWDKAGKPVLESHLDNSGENKAMKEISESKD